MLLSRDLWMEADLRMSGGGKGVSDGDEEQRAAATTRHRGPSEGDGTEPSPPSAITHYIPNSDRRSVLADSGSQAAWAIALRACCSCTEFTPAASPFSPSPAAHLSLLPSSGQRARTGSLQLIASAQGGGGRAGA